MLGMCVFASQSLLCPVLNCGMLFHGGPLPPGHHWRPGPPSSLVVMLLPLFWPREWPGEKVGNLLSASIKLGYMASLRPVES